MSSAMKPGQEAIYYITGDNLEALRKARSSKASRPRRRGAAADRPDRRVLDAGGRRLQGKAVQIG